MKIIDRNMTDLIKDMFEKGFLRRIARETKFVQRDASLTAEGFISLCIFYEKSICEASLSKLSTILTIDENIHLSPQALSEKFNEYAVEFLKTILKETIIRQNKVLSNDSSNLKRMFNRINVVDATSFKISNNLKSSYKGTGGHSANAAVKIQLQYDVLSGQILACDIGKGASSDSAYVKEVQKNIQTNDLILKDLGYFNMGDLNYIDKKKAYYISKIKKYTIVYINDEKQYSQVDILEYVKTLSEGQTLDIPDAYIGANKKLKTRLIITKLSEENKMKRKIKNKLASQRYKRGMDAERSDLWDSINVYVTNINEKMMQADEIHDLYSLRWQIEIMFKVWKSLFKINRVKKVSLHRFECFLYGKLISIVLDSIIVFKSKDFAYLNEKKYISIYKSFAIVRENSCKIRDSLLKNITSYWSLVNNIIILILKQGVKSKKKHKKKADEILELTILSPVSLV
ncbi:IS4 family transposase [Clostridium psychrophilum]|uniref:IS4 family transposase n=1 Tax=Clostridium psychrophilum TaxID=132926 RepID=UPI001C0CB850|nr:IS4 family transposase [Clostridium psychrophilum]MBU3182771.1 IS4 family transposase [Clostridium psychrophilum]